MKNSSIISTLLILLIIGCNPEKTYYDQLIKDKTIMGGKKKRVVVSEGQDLNSFNATEDKKKIA